MSEGIGEGLEMEDLEDEGGGSGVGIGVLDADGVLRMVGVN